VQNTNHSRPSVLIADDDPSLRVLLREILKEEFDIREATDGDEALTAAYSDDPPDVMVLDLLMPRVNGLEVCQRLRERADTSNIAILVLTARSSSVDQRLVDALGADAYLSKPFQPLEVLSLTRVLARAKRRLTAA